MSDAPLAHISELYKHKTTKAFKADMEFLLSRFSPAPVEVLVQQKRQNVFAITFDDGLREVAEVVAPILQKLGIPASVFVNSGFIDNRSLFYRFKAALLLREIRRSRAVKKVANLLGCQSDLGSLRSAIRSITYSDRLLLDKCGESMDYDFDAYLMEQRPYMTADQVRSLSGQGWLVGAHSIDHPRYCELAETEQIRQTIESINYVEQLCAPAFRAFAFPFSAVGVNSDTQRRLLSECRLDVMLGTRGWVHEKSRKLLNRVCLEGEKEDIESYLRKVISNDAVASLLGRRR